MEFKIEKVGGIGEFSEKAIGEDEASEGDSRKVFLAPEGKAFLVVNKNTIEVRTDRNLAKLLQEKYESVMESRYFGRGGIEVVLAGQLGEDEIYDLVRLSYNLTRDLS